MQKTKKLMMYLLSLLLILAFSAMTPNLTFAQTLIPSDPGAFSGDRLSDAALHDITGMGNSFNYTLTQWNVSSGTGNTQVSTTNGTTLTGPGFQTQPLNASTAAGLQLFLSFLKK